MAALPFIDKTLTHAEENYEYINKPSPKTKQIINDEYKVSPVYLYIQVKEVAPNQKLFQKNP